MKELININVEGKKMSVKSGTLLTEIVKEFQKDFKGPIVLALVNNSLQELNKPINEECEIKFLDITHKDGYRTYKRSLTFLMIKAFKDVTGKSTKVIVQYSIGKGYYCDIHMNSELTPQIVSKVKERMKELIKQDLEFHKQSLKLNEALEIFERQGMNDKLELLKYRRVSNVNVYNLEDLYDYFYGYMVPSTGCLSLFDLHLYDEGVVLQFVNRKNPKAVPEFKPEKKLFQVLKTTTKWGEIMKVENVGDLNEVISAGKINELILVSEALMEKRIGQIADTIIENMKEKRIIFIAGPSSSGKTTFAHRLAIQLRAHGVTPHTISVDNYFVNRELTPKDEDGNYNFEALEAIDIETFNEHMTLLLQGKTVDMPIFNFISGKREYLGNYLTLEDNDLLIIEGIHALNNKMSYSIPVENKFKIYISALTQLNIDEHNRISTTDARLIRRIVRDSRYRGTSAKRTISMWPSVRRGEESYIFPYQEEADVMFNSALIYELAILKQYAEPLLFNVPRDTEEYLEAKRLIKFLGYFLGVSSEKVPYNSLIREFIGGSCFRK